MIYEVDTLARQLPSSSDHSRRAERQGEIAMKVIGRLLVSALGFSLAFGVATAAVALEIRWGVGPDGGTPASDEGGAGKTGGASRHGHRKRDGRDMNDLGHG